jgi:hypothetical protein
MTGIVATCRSCGITFRPDRRRLHRLGTVALDAVLRRPRNANRKE